MINISELEKTIIEEGYSEELGEAKLCQDIILLMLSKSKFNRNITIKGGVVMSSLSKNIRRTTVDIDLDLIKYPLSVQTIKTFIRDINGIEGIKIRIVGKIEDLKHQDYQGKRIYVEIMDSYKYKLSSKIDIGVHKFRDIDQVEYCFDIAASEDGASLLINSPEQMVTEKLKSLLKFGTLSTRYKDVYDIYYLLDYVDKDILLKTFDILIFSDSKIRFNSFDDVCNAISKIFGNRAYLNKLNASNKNWIGISNEKILERIQLYIKGMK